MTKNEMIEIIKAENPTIRIGDDEAGYIDLKGSDYDAQIEQWANARLEILAKKELEIQQAAKKAALLERLGITADEAKLLLA